MAAVARLTLAEIFGGGFFLFAFRREAGAVELTINLKAPASLRGSG
jgi:hypothetical protein